MSLPSGNGNGKWYLGFILPLLFAALSFAGSWAVSNYRHEVAERALERIQNEQDGHPKKSEIDDLKRRLERMEDKIDRLAERRR